MAGSTKTIVAQASPPGMGGVSVIRLSGKDSLTIAENVFKKKKDFFETRKALLATCVNEKEEPLDQVLVIYFPAPNSFTGEDVLEIHCHGSPVVVDLIIKTTLFHGARIARPGEFSERAFLNNKIDLVQAEAIADLISSGSEQAAKNALSSLQGVFSKKINALVEELTRLRIYVEAAIDFPDEEDVDFLSDGKIEQETKSLLKKIQTLKKEAVQGVLLQEGIKVVIAGEPNAGKSSLLNSLSRRDSAIVTDVAGTTRDVLREKIEIKGMPVHIVDTAGLRQSDDVVEQEGIRRAWQEIRQADLLLYVFDGAGKEKIEQQRAWQELSENTGLTAKVILIENKVDLLGKKAEKRMIQRNGKHQVYLTLSAKFDQGLELLREEIASASGLNTEGENHFIARRRHIEAIEKTELFLETGVQEFAQKQAGELLAENLRLAQQSLGEITGALSSDDLLGLIFSTFCIGK